MCNDAVVDDFSFVDNGHLGHGVSLSRLSLMRLFARALYK
jgi:hypothetical protein